MYSPQLILVFSSPPTHVPRITISRSGATQLGRSAILDEDLLRAEKKADKTPRMIDRSLRLRRRNGSSCCHRGSSPTGAPFRRVRTAFYPALRRNVSKISTRVRY